MARPRLVGEARAQCASARDAAHDEAEGTMSNDQPDDAGARPRTFEFTITPFGTAEGVAIEGELAFGLWEIQAGRRLTREIRNVPAFRQAVGDDLLVGLVRLFAAVDRAAEPAPIAWTDLLRCSPLCSMH